MDIDSIIQQQQSLLHAILRTSPFGIAILTGPDLVFKLASPAYRAMLPDPKIQVIGKRYQEVWPDAYGFSGEAHLKDLLVGKQGQSINRLDLRFPDGLVHSFSLRVHRLEWDNEPALLVFTHDITQADRARRLAFEIAEESNRRAEERDAIIMAMAEAVILFDETGRATKANPAAILLYGFDPVGIRCADLIEALEIRHSDGIPLQLDELPPVRALQGETIIGQLLLLVDGDDNERIVRASASPLFRNWEVSSVVTIWHDVTERERLLEQVEVEQSRLQTFIENAPEAIMVVDEEGGLILWNPAAERMLQQPLPPGKNYEALASLNIRYGDGTPCHPRNLPLICSALDGEWFKNVELSFPLPDGGFCYCLASSAPIVDRYGNLNGAVGILQDITDRKLAEENLRKQASRSQLLATLSQAFAEAGLNFSELLDTITYQVGKVLGDMCVLSLFTEDGQWHYPAAQYFENEVYQEEFRKIAQNARFRPHEGITGQVFETGQPLMLTDFPLHKFKDFFPKPFHTLLDKLPSAALNGLVVPLRAHGRWIGALTVMRVQAPIRFSKGDQIFLQDLADRAALAIEDAQLYDRVSRRARELQSLHRATTALLSTIDLDPLLEQILDAAQSAIPTAQQGALFLTDPKSETLQIRAMFGASRQEDFPENIQPHLNGAMQAKRSTIIERFSAQTPNQTAIIAPLMLSTQNLGVLVLFGDAQDPFTSMDLHLIDSFAAMATAALHNATLYAEVQRLATTDTLTEQFNRRKFFEIGELEIHRSRRFRTPLSAIMIDLDNFKEINDTYGHAAGDSVLHKVAQRCQAAIRIIDILGRYGGDEFAILLPDADIHEAYEIAERIRQAITSEPVFVSEIQAHVSISLGIAQASADTENLSNLLGRADAALYAAKQSGRNQVAEG
jgi:diguanylate cyclase (GGDEF)-like protein